jgi:hypothetical protein
MITQEYLKELFDYKDGNLYWKVKPANRVKIGDKVGTLKDGYLNTKVLGKYCRVHRLIFLIHYGYIPKFLDHINNDRSDNRIENLREATHTENMRNCKTRSHNASGIKNVRWNRKNKVWTVRLMINKKETHFGCFKDVELAELVAIEARNKFFKEFANHG